MVDLRLGGGVTLRVINTHFDNGGGNDGVRDAAAAQLLDNVEGPTVVMGDLNTDPEDPAYATLAAQLSDVWVEVGQGAGATLPADAPVRRIDYVFSSGLTATAAALVDGSDGAQHLSDHLGVQATFAPP